MTSEKRAKWWYWALTAPFVVTMLMAALMLLIGAAPNVEGITRLGYPVYVCAILGITKLLGGLILGMVLASYWQWKNAHQVRIK